MFALEFQYNRHIKKCELNLNKPINFPCNICEKVFNSKASLASHKRTHTTIIFKCDKCDRNFKKKFIFEKHVKNCTGKKSGVFKCDSCNKIFKIKSYFEKHITQCNNKIIKKIEKFECDKCNRIFKTFFYYNKHIERCNGKCTNLENFKCDKCNKIFKKQKNYLNHINKCNFQNKKYFCEICNKEFKHQRALNGHISCVHGKNNIKEKFICPICNITLFTNKGAFKNHVKNHNEEYRSNKINKFKNSMHDFFNDEEKSKKFRELHSTRMKNNNPMFQEETREKMKKSVQEHIKNLSDTEYNKMVVNFINAPKKGNAVNHSGKYTPTKPEQMVIDFNIPELIYNGNKENSTTLRFANKKHKRSLTPDFIYKETNKLIEVFGIY